MTEWMMTRHAERRAQQRGMPSALIDAVLFYADLEASVGDGRIAARLSSSAVRRLREEGVTSESLLATVTTATRPAIYPPDSMPINGGKLGVELDPSSYSRDGTKYVKVLKVYDQSSALGYLHAGDFIYNVNGFDVRDPRDVFGVVQSGSPGTQVKISYLDSTSNFQAKAVNATLYGASSSTLATQTSKSSQASSQTADESNWCLQSGGQLALCAVGAVAVLAVVAAALSGSDSSRSSTSSSSGAAADNYSPPRSNSVRSPSSSDGSKPVDSGVGCFWGYESMGTCVK